MSLKINISNIKLSFRSLLILFLITLIQGTISAKNFTSIRTGNWNEASTWDISKVLDGTRGSVGTDYPGPNDNVIVSSSTTVRLAGKGSERDNQCNDLTIEVDAVLEAQTNQMALTIYGNFVNFGVLAGNKGDFTIVGGASTSIDGFGIIKFDSPGNSPEGVFVIEGDVEIKSTAKMIFYCETHIDPGVVITNNGYALFNYDLVGGNSSSTLINAANSYLISASNILVTGVLTANATGNTVRYLSRDDQNIKTPTSSEYYNLYIADKSTKTQQADLKILGDLTIKEGIYDCANFDIELQGDFINTGGSFTAGTGQITFNGSILQDITSHNTETFYDVVINGGGINITDNSVVATNSLTLSSGDIYTGSNKMILGTSSVDGILNWTSGGVEANFERFISSTDTIYKFPLGTAGNYHYSRVKFNSLNKGSLIGNFYSTSPGNNGLPLTDNGLTIYNTFMEGYWDFQAANSLSTPNFSFDIQGSGFTSFAFLSDTRLLYRVSSSSAWFVSGNHEPADVPNKIAKRRNLTITSGAGTVQFAIGDINNCTRPNTPTISGLTDVCSGTTNTYSVPNNSGNTYSWTLLPATAGTINSPSSSSPTISWNAIGQEATLYCIEKNGCTNSERAEQTITINSIAPKSITGKTAAAEGSTGSYSVLNIPGYTYTWTITGGTQASGGTTNAITVTWGNTPGNGTVSVVAQKGSCNAAPALSIQVHIYDIINSNGLGGGDWNVASTWNCECVPTATDNVRILAFDSVYYASSSNFSAKHFIVNSSAALNISTSADYSIIGDLDVDGLIYLTSGDLILPTASTGSGIDGSGAIITNGNSFIINKDRTFLNTALLTIDGDVVLGTGISVSNKGGILIKGDLTGGLSWDNTSGSILQLDKSITTPLNASAIGNMVSYEGGSAQNIADPNSHIYYNLEVSNLGIKKVTENYTVKGSLAILGHAQLDMNGYDMNVAIDWIDTSITANSFIEGTSTITLNGSVKQYVFTLGGETFYNLVVNNSAPVSSILIDTLSSITIINEMTFTDGIIDVRTYGDTITFNDGAGALSASSSSFVIGKVSKIGIAPGAGLGSPSFNFPIGDSIYYAPAGIFNPSSGDEYIAEYFHNSPHDAGYDTSTHDATINHISDMEYWEINQKSGSTIFTGVSYGINRSGGIDTESELTLALWDGSKWNDKGNNSQSPGQSVYSTNKLSFFGIFTLASTTTNNPLPIELLSFDAKANGAIVDLSWVTVTETNNEYFTIERSIDGTKWEAVLEKQGAGNSNQIISYSAVDFYPINGLSYYRLRQTDFDGSISWSNIVSVNFDGENHETSVLIYPNPSDGTLVNVVLGGFDKAKVLIEINDIVGHQVYSKIYTNKRAIQLDLSDLSSGVYFITTSWGSTLKVSKLLIR
ncbi:MAG: T9SS type A sorting domain-containing protein [Bacteroidales bacterium]|nr:T9SS type A sorting domain-containing protein [Bacteroidales bacterium]